MQDSPWSLALIKDRVGPGIQRDITFGRIDPGAVELVRARVARWNALRYAKVRSPSRRFRDAVERVIDRNRRLRSDARVDTQPSRFRDAVKHVIDNNRRLRSLTEHSNIELPNAYTNDDTGVVSGADSAPSFPRSSVFDGAGFSEGTLPTTNKTADPADRLLIGKSDQDPLQTQGQYGYEDESEQIDDKQTTYSIESIFEDQRLAYLHEFTSRLTKDAEKLGHARLSELPASMLAKVLKEFAQRLHAEASTPFQWETSVILHRKQE
ncbi:hypothetical protein SLS59_003213 [Nothophoma quercina]|uniref:Uncharacterized protein n=1 Tax=Nothophoma quercina TaxID=749835 RepID=A0ABR3RPF6_9PLEO